MLTGNKKSLKFFTYALLLATSLILSRPVEVFAQDQTEKIDEKEISQPEDSEENTSKLVTIHEESQLLVDWSADDSTDGIEIVEESGLVYTLTSHYFRAYNERFMTRFTDEMRTMQMEKYCASQDVSNLFSTHLCIG